MNTEVAPYHCEVKVKSTRRIIGLENEYALQIVDRHGEPVADDATLSWVAGEICSKSRTAQRDWLENGACIYEDIGNHPEYAGPECLTGWQVMLHDLVGEAELSRRVNAFNARQAQSKGFRYWAVLLKNNEALNGATYGRHENYILDKDINIEDDCNPLVGYLVSRIIMTGSGRLVMWRGQPYFQLSQRANYINNVYSSTTTQNGRGLICTRPERTEADSARWQRLQLISGDSSILNSVTVMTMDIMSLLLLMLECGELEGVALAYPIDDLKLLNTNPWHRLRGYGRSWEASEVQQKYLGEATSFVKRYDLADEWGPVLRSWRLFLRAFRGGPKHLVGKANWATKLAMWERRSGRFDGDSEAAIVAAQQLDLAFHTIAGGPSIVDRARKLEQIQVSAAMVERARAERLPTRAGVRAEFWHRTKKYHYPVSFNWMNLTWGDEKLRLEDPYGTALERLDLMTYRVWQRSELEASSLRS